MKLSLLFLVLVFCHEAYGTYFNGELIFDKNIAGRYNKKVDFHIKVNGKDAGGLHTDLIKRLPKFKAFLGKIRKVHKINSVLDIFTISKARFAVRIFLKKHIQPYLLSSMKIFVRTFYEGPKALEDIENLHEAILVRKLLNKFSSPETADARMMDIFKKVVNKKTYHLLWLFGNLGKNFKKYHKVLQKHIAGAKKVYEKVQVPCNIIAKGIDFLDHKLHSLALSVENFVNEIKTYRIICKHLPAAVHQLQSAIKFSKSIVPRISTMKLEELNLLYEEKLIDQATLKNELKHRKRTKEIKTYENKWFLKKIKKKH